MLVDVGYCWLMSVDVDQCQSILVDVEVSQYRSMSVNIGQCLSISVNVNQYRSSLSLLDRIVNVRKKIEFYHCVLKTRDHIAPQIHHIILSWSFN